MGIPRGPGGSFHVFPGGALRFPTGVNISRITRTIVTRHVAIVIMTVLIGYASAAAKSCARTVPMVLA